MGAIIAIGLLLFFIGSGTYFCIIFLNEANGAGPWIATFISLVIACIAITYVRIKEEWKISTIILAVIGCFGTIQLFILSTIKTPYFWKGDDEWFLRIASGYCSQPIVCLIGFGISKFVEESFETKASKLVAEIKETLTTQIRDLNEIKKSIRSVSRTYKQTDHLMALFDIMIDDTINVAYILSRNKRDAELLKEIENKASMNKLNLAIKGKTLSAIYTDVSREIERKKKCLNDFNRGRYSKKDWGMLKAKLKEIKQ